MSAETLAWPAILTLGIWHGINPGMGWLFAVALGMQEGRGRAVWRALPPLALGHGAAVTGAVGLALAAGQVVPLAPLKWIVGAVLVAFGVDRLRRGRHPRYGGMRMKGRQLAAWSALMASAHGAGLMVVPFVLGGSTGAAHATSGHAGHIGQAGIATGGVEGALGAMLLHTGGYLIVTCLLAAVVYRWVGVGILRRLWVNLDLVWGAALIATGLLTPLL